jgi:uncharacterized membrane protein
VSRLLRLSYLATAAWQIIWHGLLPPPLGARLPWLAVLALVPLLLPLRGLIALQTRAITWAAYLLLFYFTVAVMEAWSNPEQRLAALVQTALVTSCLVSIVLFNRRQARD